MREIVLSKRGIALVDDEDFEFLSQYKWRGNRASASQTLIYAHHTTPDGNVIVMHRLLMKAGKGEIVDHINGNGLDNRKENLRICSHADNMRNRTPNPNQGTSRFKGVHWNPRRSRWETEIRIGPKKIRRHHTDEEAAARCYDALAQEHFGEFARLNFPAEVYA